MLTFSDITSEIIKVFLLWAIVIAVFTRKLDKDENFVKWITWDLTGLRFIWEKFRPPSKKKSNGRPPSTILIWSFGIFGIYIALFGVASQRYENRTDIMETRANAVITQISKDTACRALERIPAIQNMKCPGKPELLRPLTVLNSLFQKDGRNRDICKLFVDTIETWKDNLNNIDMTGIYLKEAQLKNANLNATNLTNANFVKANLSYAILQKATLNGANLSETILTGTNLTKAKLINAILQHSDSKSVILNYANLEKAKLEQAQMYGAEMNYCVLSNANLRKANLGLAQLNNATLKGADLFGVNLVNSDLSDSDITEAHCNGADFSYARFNNSILVSANMKKAKLVGADLSGALLLDVDFEEADLSEAIGLKVGQLCNAKSLYKAVLKDTIQNLIMKKCPNLFEKQ